MDAKFIIEREYHITMGNLNNQLLHLLSEYELIEYYRAWKTANPIAHAGTHDHFREYITQINWSKVTMEIVDLKVY